jgi:hypothetical protein
LVTRAALLLGLAIACLLAFCGPASADTNYGFRVTGARISEVMTFQGDGGPACAAAGVCGYSGTVSYGFDHASGFAVFDVQRKRVIGVGTLLFAGLTSATVQGPGGGPPCTDKVLQRFDGFVGDGRSGRIRLSFHPLGFGTNLLDTYCAGPSDPDIARAHVLPALTLSTRSLRRKSLLLHVSSTRPFHAGPFVGTLAFTAEVRLRRARHSFVFFQSGSLDSSSAVTSD